MERESYREEDIFSQKSNKSGGWSLHFVWGTLVPVS